MANAKLEGIKSGNSYSYQLPFRLPVQRGAINFTTSGTIIPFNISLYHCQKTVSLLCTTSRNIPALFVFQKVLVHANDISQNISLCNPTNSQLVSSHRTSPGRSRGSYNSSEHSSKGKVPIYRH